MRNLQAINYINDELFWARRRIEQLEDAELNREMRRAQDADPDISRAYEITDDNGRKGVVTAIDLATAKKLTQPCWRITAQIFAGGATRPVDPSQPNFFDGFIAAFGEELCSYLAERGFVLRRGDAA